MGGLFCRRLASFPAPLQRQTAWQETEPNTDTRAWFTPLARLDGFCDSDEGWYCDSPL